MLNLRIGPHIALVFCLFHLAGQAQMITGNWTGRINKQKVELKIIQRGDSLTGTSYYYESPTNYRRYTIRGYFNTETNEAVWWDDQLIEEVSPRFSLSFPGKNPLLTSADFNCPGDGRMMLDGKTSLKETSDVPEGDVHLDKAGSRLFKDEWDYVIDNYTSGANDPEIIDSVAAIAQVPEPIVEMPAEEPVTVVSRPVQKPREKETTQPVTNPQIIVPQKTMPAPTIKEKFVARKKVLALEIPVTGDSIELRFYDNAEIDGDSISLFLNDNLIFQHIRLAASAYTIKIATSELKETNELIMVAENLGSIPPNTSYMVAVVGDKRYEARLESTEGSSAMIRLSKQSPGQ